MVLPPDFLRFFLFPRFRPISFYLRFLFLCFLVVLLFLSLLPLLFLHIWTVPLAVSLLLEAPFPVIPPLLDPCEHHLLHIVRIRELIRLHAVRIPEIPIFPVSPIPEILFLHFDFVPWILFFNPSRVSEMLLRVALIRVLLPHCIARVPGLPLFHVPRTRDMLLLHIARIPDTLLLVTLGCRYSILNINIVECSLTFPLPSWSCRQHITFVPWGCYCFMQFESLVDRCP